MEKLELSRVVKHNQNVATGGVGSESHDDVRHTIESDFNAFTKEIIQTRQGLVVDERTGTKIPPRNVSFGDALKYRYGTDVEGFLKTIGIYKQSMSLHDTALSLGLDNLNVGTMENLLISHSSGSFENPMGVPDIPADFRFIIPEIFTDAIRIGYEHSALHNNWVFSTQNLAQQSITMPLIKRGDGMPSRVNEGANIPVGSIQFDKKTVDVFKIGTGFKITDELLLASSLDLIFIFLQEVGNDMAIGADTQAFQVLTDGEQSDNSESAPVVGTEDGSTFAYKDFKRMFTRMRRLGLEANRVIASEEDGIDITSIPQFEGVQLGPNSLANIRSIIGVPDSFDMDTYVLPADQMMFLSAERAMIKLQYRGMLTERRRNPQNQTEELFISDWINFAIVKRDARLILDKSLAFSGNGFPSYMDIDSRINQAYNTI